MPPGKQPTPIKPWKVREISLVSFASVASGYGAPLMAHRLHYATAPVKQYVAIPTGLPATGKTKHSILYTILCSSSDR